MCHHLQASARVSRLEEELVSLKGREGAAREQAATLHAQLSRAEAERDSAHGRAAALERSLAEAEASQKSTEDRLADAERSQRSAKERVSALQAEKADAEARAEELRVRADALEAELQEQSRAGALLDEEARKLHDHIEASDNQLVQLQEQLDFQQASSSARMQTLGEGINSPTHILAMGKYNMDVLVSMVIMHAGEALFPLYGARVGG